MGNMSKLIFVLVSLLAASVAAYDSSFSKEANLKIAQLERERAQLENERADLNITVEVLKRQLNRALEGSTSRSAYEWVVSSYKMKWSEARQYCLDIGGNLAVNGMNDWSQRMTIVNDLRLSQDSSSRYWIGLSDSAQEKNFVWEIYPTNGLGCNMYFSDGQPDNNGGQDCGVIANKFGWRTDDDDCGTDHYALCERSS